MTQKRKTQSKKGVETVQVKEESETQRSGTRLQLRPKQGHNLAQADALLETTDMHREAYTHDVCTHA